MIVPVNDPQPFKTISRVLLIGKGLFHVETRTRAFAEEKVDLG